MQISIGMRSVVVGLAACLSSPESLSGEPAGKHGSDKGSWVRYSLPGTGAQLTTQWRFVRTDGEELVIEVETYLAGELRATRHMKASRLRLPPDARRETIVAGGTTYACQVFDRRGTTVWYSNDVPLLGIVRVQTGERDIMEILESSAQRRR